MSHRTCLLPVTTSLQAAARDRAAIAGGDRAFDLMLRAGTVTAAIILRDFADRLANGVAVFVGPGNNGGDGYVVAAQLLRAGIRVRLHASSPPRTPDAQRAAALVDQVLCYGAPTGNEDLVVDALLGTGHVGAFRDDIATAVERLGYYRDRHAIVVALDVPSGLDASTGAVTSGTVSAHVTVSYGTIKRGQLVSRSATGRLLVLDIGLGMHVHADDQAWQLVEAQSLHAQLTPIPWDSWKTRRGVVEIVGGAAGMAGAAIIASRAALSAGAGLVHAVVHEASRTAVHAAVPQSIVRTFEEDALSPATSFDAIAIGPGLGTSAKSAALLQRALDDPSRALVIDADALTLLAQHASAAALPAAALLSQSIHGDRRVICTPHPGEFARMIGATVPAAIAARVELVQSFALTSRATVLLKGTPTIICTPDGAVPLLVARGTVALATGGSGDMLTGLIAALLAQQLPAATAAALGAWLHGRAAELATDDAGTTRGVGLDRVNRQLARAWREVEQPAKLQPGILAALPAVPSPAKSRVNV